MRLSILKVMLVAIILIVTQLNTKAQTVFTNTGKAKYVKTTMDTFSIPGVAGVYRKGFVTNQSSTKQLYVYFSTKSGVRDTSSRVLLEPGKTLKFSFIGTKIFRVAVSDSAYSQVIVGDVQLNYKGSEYDFEKAVYATGQNMKFADFRKPANYLHRF